MSVDLSALNGKSRLLFEIPLKPIQGERFQPTGFPNLGAATFKGRNNDCLLVESAQSMANRLEMTIWDTTNQKPIAAVDGISHVCVKRRSKGDEGPRFLTDSILEAHRLNSPYLLEGSDKTFIESIKKEIGAMEDGPIDRKKLAETLLKYDVGSLLHGVFLAKKELAGGRLRVARALSAFVEAEDVRIAASGGVKNDHVNPSGDTKKGFGNIPFSRDEFTATKMTLFVNLDLTQIRGYGLGDDVATLLVLLALYKLRALADGDLRFRTACDLTVDAAKIVSVNVTDFALPSLAALSSALEVAISGVNGPDKSKPKMVVTHLEFNDELKKAKDASDQDGPEEIDGDAGVS